MGLANGILKRENSSHKSSGNRNATSGPKDGCTQYCGNGDATQ